MRLILIPLTLVFLPGCFLTQGDSVEKDPVQAPTIRVKGYVSMEDIQGDKPEASISAEFARLDTANALMAMAAPQSRSPECRLNKFVASNKATSATPLSAGQLGFRPTSSQKIYYLTEDSNHRYRLKLPSGFPSGIYFVTWKGTNTMPKFSADILSMPQKIEGPAFNGKPVPSETLTQSKKDPMRFAWKAPVFLDENDGNILILDFISKEGDTTYQLRCGGWERDFLTSGENLEFEFPGESLKKLPNSKDARLEAYRAHILSPPEGARFDISFRGLRLISQKVELGD